MAKTGLQVTSGEKNGEAVLTGPLDIAHLTSARNQLKQLGPIQTLDVHGLTRLDTAGAMLLTQLAKKNIAITRLQPQHSALCKLFADTSYTRPAKPATAHAFFDMIVRLGRGAIRTLHTTRELVIFLGQTIVALVRVLSNPRRLRFGEIVHHIEQIGIDAIPIISLIAFLISVVLAYQSTEQLAPLGAQQFTVNLITISVLREMGVLLTAIMVAGRSGSAFTAEIGVMKIREEVDALKAIGVDVFELLVVPRIIALVIAMPLLAFIANLMGLLGGAVLTNLLIGTGFEQYVDRVHSIAANGNALFVGMVKAPVFAFFIGLVGCMHGMKVSGSAESVGTETTTSVVQSIFLVLVLDALFSIFFQQVGI